ncbi:MAG TPA: hypothetical protein VFG95_09420 [Nitrospiria bacterium]|nr:hypothetical protein [Nitrospiria bacterium]
MASTKSATPANQKNIIDVVFGLVENYGLMVVVFGTVLFFLWLLYSHDFASVK